MQMLLRRVVFFFPHCHALLFRILIDFFQYFIQRQQKVPKCYIGAGVHPVTNSLFLCMHSRRCSPQALDLPLHHNLLDPPLFLHQGHRVPWVLMAVAAAAAPLQLIITPLLPLRRLLVHLPSRRHLLLVCCTLSFFFYPRAFSLTVAVVGTDAIVIGDSVRLQNEVNGLLSLQKRMGEKLNEIILQLQLQITKALSLNSPFLADSFLPSDCHFLMIDRRSETTTSCAWRWQS